MRVACQICDPTLSLEMRAHYIDNFTDGDAFNEIVQHLAPTFDDTMVLCKFFHRWSNCRDLLFPILTEEGLCFTFNSMRTFDILTTST